MRRSFCILCLILPFTVSADLYRYVDENGNVVYTDRPVPGAEPVSPGVISVIPAPQMEIEVELGGSPEPNTRTPQQEKTLEVRILSPRADEGVRANDGRVSVEVAVVPRPAQGVRLRYRALLDGQPAGPLSDAPRWTLADVPRGTHTLEVIVLDENGRELARSAPVTFHVLRVSRLIRPR